MVVRGINVMSVSRHVSQFSEASVSVTVGHCGRDGASVKQL
jgi:hypothetical protein